MIRIIQADYGNPVHAAALVQMLDAYARDPMGGGEPLSDFAKAYLAEALAARPQAFSLLAYEGDAPVGLANCIEGFSTFACKPLVNVHDLAVLNSHRGKGIAQKLLEAAEAMARERGACKLTLEVLSGNQGAVRLYERVGFAGYALGELTGQAQFMQKWLD
jgi:ribosomal protein S18 acetylase RimI-like enzyme